MLPDRNGEPVMLLPTTFSKEFDFAAFPGSVLHIRLDNGVLAGEINTISEHHVGPSQVEVRYSAIVNLMKESRIRNHEQLVHELEKFGWKPHLK
jgi:hypothetical protein